MGNSSVLPANPNVWSGAFLPSPKGPDQRVPADSPAADALAVGAAVLLEVDPSAAVSRHDLTQAFAQKNES